MVMQVIVWIDIQNDFKTPTASTRIVDMQINVWMCSNLSADVSTIE